MGQRPHHPGIGQPQRVARGPGRRRRLVARESQPGPFGIIMMFRHT
jgi:hypothetical protein